MVSDVVVVVVSSSAATARFLHIMAELLKVLMGV